MNDTLLTTLLERTYTRSDLSYRISLLREFLEFVYFTRHESGVTSESVAAFAKAHARGVEDLAFLQTLPASFFASFAQDTVYARLDDVSKHVKELPVLALTLPVAFTADEIEKVSSWVRTNVGPKVLLDITVDPQIAVGCRVVWNDQLHDFSFDHYMRIQHDAVITRVSQVLQTPHA